MTQFLTKWGNGERVLGSRLDLDHLGFFPRSCDSLLSGPDTLVKQRLQLQHQRTVGYTRVWRELLPITKAASVNNASILVGLVVQEQTLLFCASRWGTNNKLWVHTVLYDPPLSFLLFSGLCHHCVFRYPLTFYLSSSNQNHFSLHCQYSGKETKNK